jgi:hypothetical protein
MQRVPEQEFLHLVAVEEEVHHLQETLRRLERSETVIGFRDSYAEGPLSDVDAGAASRIEWYKRIWPDPTDAPREDSDLWEQVYASPAKVMLWHGPIPVERIFALRACWHLRHSPERVYEVALPATGRLWRRGVARPAFYDAVGVVGPDGLTAAWEGRTKVTDVSARAKRWEELRDQPGDSIRALEGETLVRLPLTAYDDAIVKACNPGQWTASKRVVGRVLADHPIGLALVTWRVREIIRDGALEGRGGSNDICLPAEVRALRAPSAAT